MDRRFESAGRAQVHDLRELARQIVEARFEETGKRRLHPFPAHAPGFVPATDTNITSGNTAMDTTRAKIVKGLAGATASRFLVIFSAASMAIVRLGAQRVRKKTIQRANGFWSTTGAMEHKPAIAAVSLAIHTPTESARTHSPSTRHPPPHPPCYQRPPPQSSPPPLAKM